jgi:iron complex outermembrane receptor protein
MFVNDANSESSPGYAVFNARVVTGASLQHSAAEIVLGVQNLFDKRYVSSVNVNAAGGKFYEPASRRAVYVGLTLSAAASER